MIYYFDTPMGIHSFELSIREARLLHHPGECWESCARGIGLPKVRRQLDRLGPEVLRAFVKDGFCGCLDAEELDNAEGNRIRALWLIAGGIQDRAHERGRR